MLRSSPFKLYKKKKKSQTRSLDFDSVVTRNDAFHEQTHDSDFSVAQ